MSWTCSELSEFESRDQGTSLVAPYTRGKVTPQLYQERAGLVLRIQGFVTGRLDLFGVVRVREAEAKQPLVRQVLATPSCIRKTSEQRFRGGLVFKAHRLLYHSTLGLRGIKNKKKFAPANDLIFLK